MRTGAHECFISKVLLVSKSFLFIIDNVEMTEFVEFIYNWKLSRPYEQRQVQNDHVIIANFRISNTVSLN